MKVNYLNEESMENIWELLSLQILTLGSKKAK